MRNKKNRLFLVALFVFAVAVTGVYALLATNLTVTGTAGGSGNFKIEFSDYNVTNEAKATATLDNTKTSMTINANLSYPGDTVTIHFTIKNTGALKATVNNLTVNENSNEDLTIKINGLSAIKGTVLDVGETTTGSIVVTWNEASTNPNPESVNFNVTIDYLQAT